MLTPISTPYTSDYKPLGLESFAAPLSKMQEKFDVAKSEIDKTKYALSRMSQDDERAKKLLLDLDSKTNELSQNLSRSGNYREATQQLKNLNEWFNSNKELSGMRSNYDSYKENYKLMKDRIDGTNMTQKILNFGITMLAINLKELIMINLQEIILLEILVLKVLI